MRRRYLVVEGLRLTQSRNFDDFASAFRCALRLSSPEFPIMTILLPADVTAFPDQESMEIAHLTGIQAAEIDHSDINP